jgi:DNA-binding NarL/FixJ family response regulator
MKQNLPLRIVIVDDHPLVRSGIRTALESDPELIVVAEAADGDEGLRAVLEHRPDLLLLDVSMPGLAAEELVARAHQEVEGIKTLILSAYDDDVYVRNLTRVPISGYLLKDHAPEDLLQAIDCLRKGGVWFSQSVARKLMGLKAEEVPAPAPYLTTREQEVLAGISRGEDNPTIAKNLDLAEQTVRNYASTLYHKIGVHSRLAAAIWARERGVK